MTYQKSNQMLLKDFQTQIRFLKSSTESFDGGFEDEAKRLATSLRVLLHDAQYPSLFSTLGIKNNFLFATSANRYLPINLVAYTGLVGMSFTVGGEAKYQPICKQSDGTQNIWVYFDDWWNQIIIDDKTNIFSRRDIVLYAANKDGGTHIDPKIENKYYELILNNSVGWECCENDISRPMDNNLVYASIRQIVHEFLFSVDYHHSIDGYTRTKCEHQLKACYINNKLYYHEKFDSSEDISSALFNDSRIEKKENRKIYQDKLRLKNGSYMIRNVVSKL